MPGIFGLVVVDQRRDIDLAFASSILANIEDRLQHTTNHKIERWNDPSGRTFVCRIGPEEVNSTRWYFESGEGGRKVSAFLSGMLHANSVNKQSTGHESAKLYLEAGISGLSKMHGFFAAAFYAHSTTSTVIATDRRASIPIYYRQSGGILYFAPEPKALIDVPGFRNDLDLEAVAALLTSGHTLGHQCLIRSIRRLGGGQALHVNRGSVKQETYWEFSPGSDLSSDSERDLQEELAHLVEAAVERNLGHPDRTAIFLSGGADSRAILGGALAAVRGRGELLRTVTWGNNRRNASTDAGVAEMIANEFQLRHDFLYREVDRYSSDFSTVNYLVDGQCDLAALHPSEYRLMRTLRRAGITRTLRGDQLFGQRHKVYSTAEAVTEACIRRVRDISLIAKYTNPSTYRKLQDASDAAVDSVAGSVQHLEPNNAKDVLYYNHRLQVYMNNSAYCRQVFLESRNVLLDEDILDFLARVPSGLRVNKQLFRNAMNERYPDLWKIPFSTENSLEDWDSFLTQDTPVRQFVMEQLEDTDSEIWTYFDRRALIGLLDSLSVNQRISKYSIGRSGRALLRTALYSLSPRIRASIRRKNEGSYHPANRAIFRVLTLKNWYDTFLSGDKSPREQQKCNLVRILGY